MLPKEIDDKLAAVAVLVNKAHKYPELREDFLLLGLTDLLKVTEAMNTRIKELEAG